MFEQVLKQIQTIIIGANFFSLNANEVITIDDQFWILVHACCNPTLAKCGGEAQHLEKWEVWSPPGLLNVQSSTARPKTPCIGVFLVSLKRS